MITIYTANLITIKNNKILLVKRNNEQSEGGLWSLPGGTKEATEKIEECLTREIKEELGVDVTGIRPLNKYNSQGADKKVIASYFSGKIKNRIRLDKNELSEYKWFELNNIPDNLAYRQNSIITDSIPLIEKL